MRSWGLTLESNINWYSNMELVRYLSLHGTENEKRLANIISTQQRTIEELQEELEERWEY